jgi:hypothetical protein
MLFAALAAVLFLGPAPVFAQDDETSSGSTSGSTAKYHYRYFPTPQVYFDPSRNLYFWMENGQWQEGQNPPAEILAKLGKFVILDKDADKPYVDFATDSATFTIGWERRHSGRSHRDTE